MSLISSVTGAAAALATGLDHVTGTTTGIPTSAGQRSRQAGEAVGFTSPLRSDSLTVKLAAAKGKKWIAAKAPAKGPTSRTTVKARPSTPRAGYASGSTSADFAFLKDPTLSVEEKLFRFMCAIAKRNDDEVLKKMEEMKGGPSKAASSSGGSSSAASAKKSSGFSVWSALKVMIPALGITAKVLGDAQLKSLLTQLSGPVLAGAATALGLPMLAPLALSAGPKVVREILDGKLGGEGPAAAGEGAGSGSTSTSGGGGSSSTTSTSATSGKNEQVQLMELQRLIDKQKEMFAMVSNILRAQHDTRMSIIGNVR